MRSAKKLMVVAFSVAALMWAAAPAAAQSFDELLAQVPQYKLGQSRKALQAVEDLVIKNATDPAQRAMMARKLAALLANPQATFEAKDFVCRQLYLIGTAAEASAVAALLTDEQLSHMARYVLERMEDPAAGAALRQAMSTTKGKLLIGVVNSVGNRRDAEAVAALRAMLGGQDVDLAAAAAAALGKIGGPEALAALNSAKATAGGELKNTVLDAILCCADQLLASGRKAEAGAIYADLYINQPARVRMAALRGMVEADPGKTVPVLLALLRSEEPGDQAVAASYVARAMPGEAITRSFVAALSRLSPGAQAVLIDALGVRGDVTAKPAVMGACKSEDESVRIAGIKALGRLGSASDVALLAGIAAQAGRAADAARASLASLRGQDVDGAIQSALASDSPEVRVELVKALAARGVTQAVPALLALAARDAAEPVRVAALNAVGPLAGQQDYAALVQGLVSAASDAQREAARAAVAAVANRIGDKQAATAPVVAALPGASAAAKVALVSTLSRIGGEAALAAVRAAQKDADAAVQDAAVRAITEWPDADAAADMMTLARSGNEKQKVLALRGLVRVISRPDARMPAAQATALYKQMLEASSRAEEKRLVLAGLADVKDAGALDLAAPFLADAALRNEAATAIIKIAKAVGANRPAARAALQKVVAAEVDPAIRKQAQDALPR